MNTLNQNALNIISAVIFFGILLSLAGCGTSGSAAAGSTGSAALLSGGATYMYALQEPSTGADTVLQFAAGGSGARTPTGTVALPTGFAGQSIAVDGTGKIWVGGLVGTQYEAIATAISTGGGSGSIGSSQVILLGTNTGASFDPPVAMTTDSTNSLYVAGFAGDIKVFASTATGSGAPARTISGSSTTLSNYYPEGIAIDGSGDIYIAAANTSFTGGAVLEFAAGANGNVSPSRTIPFSSTSIPTGITVDSSGNMYVTLNGFSATSAASIVELSSSANSGISPMKTLTPSGTAASEIGGISIDRVGNLYTIMLLGSTSAGSFQLLGIGPGATGSGVGATLTSTSLTNPATQIAIQ